MYSLTAEQIARLKSLHQQLLKRSLGERPENALIHEHLDVEHAHSFMLFRCTCTDNPHCTGYILGIVECDTGSRVNLALKLDDLTKFVADVWQHIGTEVRQ